MRADRGSAGVPEQRRVPMPTSSSFPSGHSASAFAFAGAVAGSMPGIAVPLRGSPRRRLSRVHTGVHFPGDVVVGSLVGAMVGETTSLVGRALRHRRARAGPRPGWSHLHSPDAPVLDDTDQGVEDAGQEEEQGEEARRNPSVVRHHMSKERPAYPRR